MAKFSVQYTNATLPGRSSSVRANIDVSTGDREIGQAVSGVGGAVHELGMKYDLLEANTQFSKYKSEVDKLNFQRDAEVLNAADADEVKAIYEKYEEQKAPLHPKNSRASQAAGMWDNMQADKTARSMFDVARNKTIENERVRIFELGQEVAVNPSKLPDFEKELAKTMVIDKDNPDEYGPVFSKLEGAKILAETRKGAEEARTNNAVSIVENKMVGVAASNGWDAAITSLSDPANLEMLAKAGVGLEESKKVLTNMNAFANAQKEIAKRKQEELQQNNTNDFTLAIADSRIPLSEGHPKPPPTPTDINNAFRAGSITIQQRDGLIKRLEKPNIATDRMIQSDLYTKSLDIWRGAITKAEFDKELNKNSAKLDDNDYKSLSKFAADTLKSSQAEALSRSDTEAGRLIVDFREEDVFKKFISDSIKGLSPDAASLFQDEANETRQLQFWYLSKYNTELRDWVTENPDKLGKDFYQFSESLKHQYWNTSLEEIRKLKADINVPAVSPKTLLMTSPTGKKFEVPVGKKQLFLDNGYTE